MVQEDESSSSAPSCTRVSEATTSVQNISCGTKQKQSCRQHLIAFLKENALSVIPICVSAFAVIFAYKQADIASKALNVGQRAFVHLEGIDHTIADNWESLIESNSALTVFNAPRNLGKMIHTRFRLTNSGNTPTKAFQVMLHCELVEFRRARQMKEPFGLLRWDSAKVIARSIGAHQTIEITSDSCDFKNSDVLLNAQMRIVPVFLIGDVRYEDWIEPGKIHRTQFAHQLIVHAEGDMPGFQGMNVETQPIGEHNCTDEDCKDN